MIANNKPEQKEQEREQIVELGSDITKSKKGNIYTLTIIGQVEGHQVLPETAKTLFIMIWTWIKLHILTMMIFQPL